MKDLARRAGIPTAGFAVFDDADAALAHIRERGAPVVVKADGLAAGKGVTAAATVEEAEAAVGAAMVERAFGEAGARVVIEDCLAGEEVSAFALADGERVLMLETAQDYKRVGEGEYGAQYRRHGQPLARAARYPGTRRHGRNRNLPAGRPADGGGRHALSRRAVRRPDDRGRRPEAAWSSMSASAIRRR